MKKVLALFTVISFLPLAFAQTEPARTTSGTFSGTVLPRCTVLTNLGNAELRPSQDGVNSDGFVTTLGARAQYEFLSNSGCEATVASAYTTTAAETNGNGTCFFDNNAATHRVDSAVFRNSNNKAVGVNAKVTSTKDFLLAGTYTVTCSVNLTAF